MERSKEREVERAGELRCSSPASKRRLLVLEDEPVLAALLQDVFRLGGYEVVVARDVAAALAAAQLEPPDLCVTDFLLPDRNGLEFARALVAAGNPPPVVMVTAYLEPDLEAEIEREPSIELVVRKPMDVFALRANVDRILDERLVGP